MARRGVPIKDQISKEQFIQALKKQGGFVYYTCKELGIDTHTFYKLCELYPGAKEAVLQARVEYDEKSLDQCERVLDLLVSKVETDPAHAYKSAVYKLNNKGRSRGYAHPDVTGSEKLADAFSTFNDKMKEKENERKQRKSDSKKSRSDSE